MARARAKYEITAEDKSKRAFDSVGKRLGGLTKGFGKLGVSLAGLVGVGGFGALIKSSIDAGDKIQKLAIRTGATTEFLSEMRGVTELAGVGFDQFTNSISKMQRSLVDATRGLKTQEDAFKALGLSPDKLLKLKPAEQFSKIGDALRGVENDTLRSAIAMELFGRSGGAMLQITQQGSDAIAKQREEQRKMGNSLSRLTADEMARANDAIANLKGAFTGLGTAIASDFAGPMADAVDVMREAGIPALKAFGELAQKTLKTLGKLLSGDFTGALREASGGPFGGVTRPLGRGDTRPIGVGDPGAGRLEGSFTSVGRTGPAEVTDPQLQSTNEILMRISDQLRDDRVAVAG